GAVRLDAEEERVRAVERVDRRPPDVRFVKLDLVHALDLTHSLGESVELASQLRSVPDRNERVVEQVDVDRGAARMAAAAASDVLPPAVPDRVGRLGVAERFLPLPAPVPESGFAHIDDRLVRRLRLLLLEALVVKRLLHFDQPAAELVVDPAVLAARLVG